MNTLSWLLYLAYVTDSLGKTFSSFAIFFTIVAVIGLVVWAAFRFVVVPLNAYDYKEKDRFGRPLADKEPEDVLAQQLEVQTLLGSKMIKTAFRFMVFMWIMALGLHIAASVLPDKKTVTLIAASQIGERFVNNEKVQKVFDPSVNLLETWMEKETLDLKGQIEEMKNPKSKDQGKQSSNNPPAKTQIDQLTEKIDRIGKAVDVLTEKK